MNDPAPKLALLFPGVGSQETGMAKSFYDNLPYVRDVFEEASDLLHLPLKDICFSGDAATEMHQIDISQVALFTSSIAIFRAFQQELGLTPAFCLGHSLGEYSALCAGGMLQFADALHIVYQRGQIIKALTAEQRGTMMWVINLETQIVDAVCAAHCATDQQVFVSAYDSPTQSTISGTHAAIMQAAQALEQQGALVYPLKLSGPYHSPLMQPAADAMREVLSRYRCSDPTTQVIANDTAQPYADSSSVARHLTAQLVSPIRWHESIRYLISAGVRIALEIGPKNVLQFLLKKNTADIQVLSLNAYAQLEEVRRRFVIDDTQALAVIERCLRTATSTKNYHHSSDEYHTNVVRPYTAVEQLYYELAATNQAPTHAHVAQAIAMVESVLAAKRVPDATRQRKISDLLGNKLLKLSA